MKMLDILDEHSSTR